MMIGRFLCAALLLLAAGVQAGDSLQAFPPAGPGMTRWLLQLPPRDDEDALQVQLIVGQTVEVDPGNRYFFTGGIEREVIQGWGFSRYVVRTLGAMAGTLMAVDPRLPKVARFVSLGGEPYLVRYNSRLPVVVYVPEGAEVRYRIWSAGETRTMTRG